MCLNKKMKTTKQNKKKATKIKRKGMYMTLDMYDCVKATLDDVAACYKYLDGIPAILGMKKIAPPCVVVTDGDKYPDKAGISAWIPLHGSSYCSGVSIHTLTPTNFISIDIFGYGKINLEEVKRYSEEFFKPKKVESERFYRESIF